MAGRISSAVVVGRVEELATLRAARARARGGFPTLVIVSGEAGVGKSRLIRESTNQARDEGWIVLASGAIGSMDRVLPLAPFTMALRSALEGLSEDELATMNG